MKWKKILIISFISLIILALILIVTIKSLFAGIILIFLIGIGYFAYKKREEWKNLKLDKENMALEFIKSEKEENGRTNTTIAEELRGIEDESKKSIESDKSIAVSDTSRVERAKQSIRIY